MPQHARLPLIGLSLCLTPAGCIAPPEAAIVSARQQDALARISHAWATDHALLDRHVRASLSARRTILLGGLHREVLARGYISPSGEPSRTAFEADLASGEPPSALSREVREGRLTLDQAVAYLNDYALTMRLSKPVPARDAMLARLEPVRIFDADARSLLAALEMRRGEVARLLADAEDSRLALHRTVTQSPLPDPRSVLADRNAWVLLIERAISDPERRRGAIELLDLLIAIDEPRSTAPLALAP